MTDDALLLLGRDTAHSRTVLETHARRLRSRDLVAEVETAVYEHDPVAELGTDLADVDADQVYAVPMTVAHTYETVDDVPAALSSCPGEVHYCEPVGRYPAVTSILTERARACTDPVDASLVLVGLGNSALPYGRQTVEYHASRIRDRGPYEEVVTSYLLQNPTAECARYNVSGDRAAAVPVFVARSGATEEQIPARLELDRGGFEYADPIGEHPRLTDAIHAEVEKERVLADSPTPSSFEQTLTVDAQPMATDGRGPR